MLTSEQLRAARAALRLEQSAVAEKAGVSVETIKRLERMDGELKAQLSTLDGIRSALEAEGIEFLDSGYAEGPGIRVSNDKTSWIRKDICEEIIGWIDLRLKDNLEEDPAFLHRDIDYIVTEITAALPRVLRLALPDVLKRHKSEE